MSLAYPACLAFLFLSSELGIAASSFPLATGDPKHSSAFTEPIRRKFSIFPMLGGCWKLLAICLKTEKFV